jgi:adenosylhomocysteine nucleosidase
MIAVVFALEYESAVYRARSKPQLLVDSWVLGAMGVRSVSPFEAKLSRISPDIVISAGFAGGLTPATRVGDLIIGQNYTDPGLLEKLNRLPGWRLGDLYTADAIVEASADKLRLGASTGAMIADLETAHLAEVCLKRGIPFVSVRCISDAADDDMPVPADVLMNPVTGRPEPLALFRHLVSKPSCVPAFNTLLRNAKAAQSNLAKGLDQVVSTLLRS